MREKGLCEKYMGKFPVISISLKSVGGFAICFSGGSIENSYWERGMPLLIFCMKVSGLAGVIKNCTWG